MGFRRQTATLLAGACAALLLAAPAAADVTVGVADDRGKLADDGGAAFFASIRTPHTTELASAPLKVLSGSREGKRLKAL